MREAKELLGYATEEQIEFFDRLRSGDDPVHEEARTELVELANDTVPMLAKLVDHGLVTGGLVDAVKLRRVMAGLMTLAGMQEPKGPEVDAVPTTFYKTWATGYSWFYKAEFEAVQTPAHLAPVLNGIAADIAEAQTLCTTPGITLDDVTFDKRDGYLFHFSTTDAEIAEKLGFEMKRRRWSPTVKPFVGNGSRNIASDYMVNQARGFIAWGLRRMLAESAAFTHTSCLEGRFHACGHQNGPTTPCVCCGEPVAVPCRICENAWNRGLASLVQSGAVVVDGDKLRAGDLEALLAVPDPKWRSS